MWEGSNKLKIHWPLSFKMIRISAAMVEKKIYGIFNHIR